MDPEDIPASPHVEYFGDDFSWESLKEQLGKNGTPDAGCDTETEVVDIQTATWESFHRQHSSARFFKERRYLSAIFPFLTSPSSSQLVLEIGCGTGANVLPLLRSSPLNGVVAVDFSPTAVRLTEAAVASLPHGPYRFAALLCDAARESLPDCLAASTSVSSLFHARPGANPSSPLHFDVITLFFTLSSVPPPLLPFFLLNLASVLRPGGVVCFRDYGLYDMAQLRFPRGQQLGPTLFQREDGTLAHFFSKEALGELFASAGFDECDRRYCCVKVENRRTKVGMARVWLHAKFSLP